VSHGGGPPIDDVALGGEDRDADPVEGVDTAKWTRGGVCGLTTKGWHPVDLGTKVDDGLLRLELAARTTWIW
jgi:hypothetical protein